MVFIRRRVLVFVLFLAAALADGPEARGDDRLLCLQAALSVERDMRLPKAILQAIAMTESGRYQAGGTRFSWPWTVNNAGDAYFLDSKDQAVALVKKLKRQGERNIDVGCMQVNLHFHPDAFADLKNAFDPLINAQYAGDFLKTLRFESGTWARAIERYHSNDRARGRYYRRKVSKNWRDVRLGKTILDRGRHTLSRYSSINPGAIVTDSGVHVIRGRASTGNNKDPSERALNGDHNTVLGGAIIGDDDQQSAADASKSSSAIPSPAIPSSAIPSSAIQGQLLRIGSNSKRLLIMKGRDADKPLDGLSEDATQERF